MKIINVRHSWPEKEGFFLSRNRNNKDYIFLHFFNSVEISYRGNTYNTLPNSVVIFRPSTHHSFLSRVPLKHNWFHFSLKSEEEIAKFGIEFDKIYSIQDGDFITKILRTVENEFLAPKSYSDELIGVKLNELFIKLYRVISGENFSKLDKNLYKRLDKVRLEMFSNLEKNWTVENLAQIVGISKSRFYTVYKQTFGNSPIDDLICARMESAKDTLIIGDDNIGAIAENLGYNNTTHFIRQFKSYCGVSPSKYRKENMTGR